MTPHAGTGSADVGLAFSRALARALPKIDATGHFDSESVRELRRALAETPAGRAAEIGLAPERHLPAFESLPEEARRAIAATVGEADRWRMRGHELGGLHVAVTRLFWALRLLAHRSRLGRPTEGLADTLAFGMRAAPAWGIDQLACAIQRLEGRRGARPHLLALLRAAGIDPRDLAVCYARGISQRPPYRGFWRDPERHQTVGAVLGLDLVPGAEGYWFVESNLGIGIRPERWDIYERDPMIESLLDYARDRGYARLLILDNNADGVIPKMAAQLETGARSRGLELTLVARQSLPRSPYRRGFGLPPFEGDATLAVRIKHLRTSLDYLFDHKGASVRALQCYQKCVSDPDLLVPTTTSEPQLDDVDPDGPYPNLVYKLPDLDKGRGLIFLKASSPEHARTLLSAGLAHIRPRGLLERLVRVKQSDHRGAYQAFVGRALRPDRRLSKIRAQVLVTPTGATFLSAHRGVSAHPVPEQLPFGVVTDPAPYLINQALGAEYESVDSDEEPAVRAASLAVARGLCWAASAGFETAPPPL